MDGRFVKSQVETVKMHFLQNLLLFFRDKNEQQLDDAPMQ